MKSLTDAGSVERIVRIKHFVSCLIGAWFSLTGGCTTTATQRDDFAVGYADRSYPVYEGGEYGVGGRGAPLSIRG